MWTRHFEPIASDLDGAPGTSDVLVQFHRHCPDPLFEPKEVQWDRGARFNDYQLVRLIGSGATGEEIESYGLFAPGDYRPLDALGDRLKALGHNAPWEGDPASLEEILLSWQRYAARSIARRTKFPKRAQSVLPVQHWETAEGKGNTLFEALRRGVSDIRENTLIRIARVSFYRNYKLVELLNPEKIHYRRGYCFVKEDAGELDVRPVTGRSELFHAINALPDELVLDTEEQVCDYIRMFCWGVLGDEGPFLVPRYRREMNFHRPLDGDQLRNLPAELSFSPVAEDQVKDLGFDEETPAHGKQRAMVIYGNAAFLAAFAVQANGSIGMVDDAPLLMDLPLVSEPFGKGNLFVPAWQPPTTSPGTTITSEAESVTEGSEAKKTEHYGARFLPGDEPRDGKELLVELARDGYVTQFTIGQEVTMSIEPVAGQEHKCYTIDGVYFLSPVHFASIPKGASLRFRNCVFAAGLDGRLGSFGGDVGIEKCTFGKLTAERHQDISIDFSAAEIAGDLLITDCHVRGVLFANNVRIAGDLHILGNYLGMPPRGAMDDAVPHLGAAMMDPTVDSLKRGTETDLENTGAVFLEKASIEGDMNVMARSPLDKPNVNDWQRFNHVGAGAEPPPEHVHGVLSVCRGGLMARGIAVGRNIQLGGSIWMGSVDFSQSRCRGGISTAYHIVRNDRYERIGIVVANGDLLLFDAEVADQIDLCCAEVFGQTGQGDVHLHATQIDGRLNLLGLRCSGDLVLSFARIVQRVRAQRSDMDRAHGRPVLEVGGDLILSGATIGMVDLAGISVGKEVLAVTGSFGRLHMRFGVEPDAGGRDGCWPKPCVLGSMVLSSLEVKENLDLSGAQVGMFEKGPHRGTSASGVRISQCRVGGDLLLYTGDLERNLSEGWYGGVNAPPIRWLRPVPATKEPDPAGSQDEVERLSPIDHVARIRGTLNLQATIIGGHLDLRNTIVERAILLNDAQVKLDVRVGHRSDPDDLDSLLLRSFCDHMNAEKLMCDGDVFLTGLTVGISPSLWKDLFAGVGAERMKVTEAEQERSGVLKAREVRVRGEWLLQPRMKQRDQELELARRTVDTEGSRDHPWQALIHGRLDLSAAVVNHLVMGKYNWPVLPGERPSDVRTTHVESRSDDESAVVNLERGVFNRLEIVWPTPAPICLSKISVGRWEFGGKEDRVEHYIGVLNVMQPFDSAVWTSVERDLRDRARDGEADDVYVAMREMAWRQRNVLVNETVVKLRDHSAAKGSSWRRWWRMLKSVLLRIEFAFRAVGHWLSRVLLAHTTAVGRPMLLWVLFFAWSIWIFSDPHNVELDTGSPYMVEIQEGHATGKDPILGILSGDTSRHMAILDVERTSVITTDQWNWRDGVFLAMEYHVPLIDLSAPDQWGPGSRKPAQLGALVTAQSWAAAMRIYSYVAWSLLLLGLGAKAYRGKR